MSELSSGRKKILVVEDDVANQHLMQEMMRELGHEVVIAPNGKEGVLCAQSSRYDLVFMDIKMPVMDGYEASRVIRSFDEKIPIVALTAYAMEWSPIKCVESGMNDIIYKPVSLEKLRKEVLKWAVGR